MTYQQRPKRLKVPQQEVDICITTGRNDGSAYEWDWDSFYHETHSKRRRPFPSSSVLASLPRKYTATDIPLIRTYIGGSTTTDEQLQVQEVSTHPSQGLNPFTGDAIDQPSTLTAGQHKRYLQLYQNHSKSWNEKHEWKKLKIAVEQEQLLYLQAQLEFFKTHSDRYLVGFRPGSKSYKFASFHADYVKAYIQQWKTSYKESKFGKCLQIISLRPAQQEELLNISPNDLFDSLNVLGETDIGDDSNRISNSNRIHKIKQGDIISSLQSPSVPPFLSDNAQDDAIMLLAQQHGASIVTTQETLLELIQEKDWRIPMTRTSGGVILLDVPLPRPSTTRDCLTKGMQDAINTVRSTGYTLLTVKTKRIPLRVLVRSNNVNRSMTHVHLEYFAERGWEVLTSEERASWILDVLLGCSSSQVARVCPQSASVLRVDAVGVAHALANDQDPMRHFQVMSELLAATETMPDGKLLLLVLNGSSIHVHRANDGEPEIDLEKDFASLDAVYTGPAALEKCALSWEWDSDRIQNTFPI